LSDHKKIAKFEENWTTNSSFTVN